MPGEIVTVLTSAGGKGFGVVHFWTILGPCSYLSSSDVRDRDKALLRGILSGGRWNGFLLGKVQGENVPYRFCGGPGVGGRLFWDCFYPPLVHLRELPEFRYIVDLLAQVSPFGMAGYLLFLALRMVPLGLREASEVAMMRPGESSWFACWFFW